MKSNKIANSMWTSWAWPATLLAAAGTAGLWLWLTHGAYVPIRSAVGLVALTGVVGAVWLYRIRAARRLFAALDAYAEQELDRVEHRPPTSSRKSSESLTRSSA
jgi:hypothetical protein